LFGVIVIITVLWIAFILPVLLKIDLGLFSKTPEHLAPLKEPAILGLQTVILFLISCKTYHDQWIM